MFWSHFVTVLWLQHRLKLNQLQRQGALAKVIGILFTCVIVAAGALGFVVALVAGLLTLPQVNAEHLLLIWLGTLAVFCAVWIFGIAIDIQRTDSMSIEKLLHLPITPKTAFLVNYFSSYVNLVLAFFLPTMIGFSIAQVLVCGPGMLVVFPLVVSFVVMITAVTYQLRGWLATLMVNKRRRRMIMSLMMFAVVGCTQIPNLVNVIWMRQRNQASDRADQTEELVQEYENGEIATEEFERRLDRLKRPKRIRDSEVRDFVVANLQHARPLVRFFPPLWVADGVSSALKGQLLPAGFQTMAALLIAGASLSRSYRTTLRFYRGEFTAGTKARASDPQPKQEIIEDAANRRRFHDKTLPLVSETASTVAISTTISFLRAAEARMAFGSALIVLVVFGGIAFGGGLSEMPIFARPLFPLLGLLLIGFSLLQVSGNQFGFDRQGFRLFVLSPINKRDVLLGKNLALAPFVLGIASIATVVFQFIQPMRATHVLATLLQFVTIYLTGCLATNLMSILVPMKVAGGAFRKNNPGIVAALKQMFCSMLMPIGALPTLIPWGLDAALTESGWNPYRIPVYALLAAALMSLAIWSYWKLISAQGRLLQARQQAILEIVAREND